MDIATNAAFVPTVFVISATLVIQVSMTLTTRAKCDLVALVWIWAGTMTIGLIAIPDAISFLLTSLEGQPFLGRDGAQLLSPIMDTAAQRRYLRYALPALAAISGGIFLQGWSIRKAG